MVKNLRELYQEWSVVGSQDVVSNFKAMNFDLWRHYYMISVHSFTGHTMLSVQRCSCAGDIVLCNQIAVR